MRYSPIFIEKAKEYIVKEYGKDLYDDYYSKVEEPKKDAPKEVIQDAHEAIRVIDPTLTPDSIKNKISADDYKLYKLI
jgi:DNA topoisomerase-1